MFNFIFINLAKIFELFYAFLKGSYDKLYYTSRLITNKYCVYSTATLWYSSSRIYNTAYFY